MKTKKLFFSVMLSACGILSLSAQVKVDANGRTYIGEDAISLSSGCYKPFLYLGSKTGSVSGQTAPYGFLRNGEILYLAASRYDFCPIDHKTVFSTNYNGNVGIGKAPDAACTVDVSGQLRAANVPLTSDERLKRNIQPVSQELIDNLYDLKAQSYEKLEIRTELIPDDKGNMVEQVILKEPDQKYIEYGFMAQELQKLFPDLISTGADGYLSVRYISLIPVMIEALKDQKARIEELESKAEIKQLRSATSEETATSLNTIAATACRLYQNAPNPFSQNTQIKYYLPETTNTASLCIYDLQGKQLKRYPLTQRGEGMQRISASEFSAGMYLYVLIADGQKIDVKEMLLTE